MSDLNGGTDLLAKAMRQVVAEAVEGGVKPLRQEIAAMSRYAVIKLGM